MVALPSGPYQIRDFGDLSHVGPRPLHLQAYSLCMFFVLGFGVWVLGFVVWGLWLVVWGLGFGVGGLGFRV